MRGAVKLSIPQKRSAGAKRALDVEGEVAAQPRARDGGAEAVAAGASHRLALAQSRVDVDERAGGVFAHIGGPQDAVDVHPLRDSNVEETPERVRLAVAARLAQNAAALVRRFRKMLLVL